MPDNVTLTMILQETQATRREVENLRVGIEGPGGLRQEVTATRGKLDEHIAIHKDREDRETGRDTEEFAPIAGGLVRKGESRVVAFALGAAVSGAGALAIAALALGWIKP